MVWRDQERSGGGSSADDSRSRNHGDNETETLLEPEITSPDVESVDGAVQRDLSRVTSEEAEPLIEKLDPNNSKIKNQVVPPNPVVATPSTSRRLTNEKHPPSSPLVAASRSCSRGVPVMLTLEPSDRASLNSGSTMYMRTSPMHPPLHPCRGANSEAGSGSGSAERPIIPLTRPSPIPMLPCTTTTVTVATASQEAIQLATVENSPKSLASDQNSLDLYNICSPKALCGPHPKKVTIVVALILSIWASFVLGINIHKRVITMEDKLASMTQKMLDLQVKYLDLQVQSAVEIKRLHQKVNDWTEKANTYPGSNSRQNNEDSINVDKRSRKTTTSITTTSTTTTTTKGDCMTKKGVKCILPFNFMDERHDGCVKRWTDTAYWCPTRVDDSGSFINSNDAWDYCDLNSCPKTIHNDFTWG